MIIVRGDVRGEASEVRQWPQGSRAHGTTRLLLLVGRLWLRDLYAFWHSGPVHAISCMRARNVPGGRGGGLVNALLFVKCREKLPHHSSFQNIPHQITHRRGGVRGVGQAQGSTPKGLPSKASNRLYHPHKWKCHRKSTRSLVGGRRAFRNLSVSRRGCDSPPAPRRACCRVGGPHRPPKRESVKYIYSLRCVPTADRMFSA